MEKYNTMVIQYTYIPKEKLSIGAKLGKTQRDLDDSQTGLEKKWQKFSNRKLC